MGTTRIAAKTLSLVEVSAEASNQHELHAGTLRRHLALPDERVEGTLTFVFYLRDGEAPVVDEDDYTLCDVRRDTPGRSEWHLYYYSRHFQVLAEPGDLLVVMRPPSGTVDLFALVARPGTRVERDIRRALAIDDREAINRFLRPSPRSLDPKEADQIALDLSAPAAEAVSSHPIYGSAVEARSLPSTSAMARAAQEIMASSPAAADPDRFLLGALEAESELFFAIEAAIGSKDLNEMIERGGDFGDVMALMMSKMQARRSRRGYSLQNHLEYLLDRESIPYTPQCTDEHGATPDFVLPSCEAYHDPSFPAERLRMIGCKSRIRERWKQYLGEAPRIPLKYHVAVDEDLSDDSIRSMHHAGLRLYMPEPIIQKAYEGRGAASLIRPIRELISDLRKI